MWHTDQLGYSKKLPHRNGGTHQILSCFSQEC